MTDNHEDQLLGLLLDGRYRIKVLLGVGGMGRVFLAHDVRLGRDVAVKVLTPDATNDTLAERLFREARAAARVDHHGVAVTFSFGTDPDEHLDYLVMEHLRGESLAQRLAAAPRLPLEVVARLAVELCDVLAAVHAASIVHRDLKPSNVFLATKGRRVDEVKLLDFGVAKQLDLQTLTRTGQVYGTIAYMAPEQLVDSKRVDARSDLYALGVVLFECLAGVRPFQGDDLPTLIRAITLGAVPDVLTLRPDCPERLAAAVKRCMARAPEQRFECADDVAEALQGL